MALDGVDVARDFRENRGRVAGTCTNLQDPFSAVKRQGLGHERDDVGLRDCLPLLNRQRGVFIGKLSKLLRHKGFTGHAPHGIENRFGANTSREDGLIDHLLAKLLEIHLRYTTHQ